MSTGRRLILASRKPWVIKAGLSTAVSLLLLISIISFTRVQQFADSSRLVEHTHVVIENIKDIMLEVKEAESTQRGYLISGEADFLKDHQAAVRRLPERIANLREITSDNQTQQNEISLLEDMVNARLHVLKLAIDMLIPGDVTASAGVADIVRGTGRVSMVQMQTQAARMIDIEESLLTRRSEQVANQAALTKRWILFGNMLAIMLLMYAIWIIMRESEQRRIAQREVQKSMAQLELTNKELESFSYSVSHDLRSPLRAIDGYSRILQEDYDASLDDEGRRILKVVRDSSKKMGMLIDDLLTFSRLGRKPVEPVEVDMNQLVDDVWRDVTHNVEKIPELKCGDLPRCQGDRSLLRQVLMNLLSNALKYSSTREFPLVEVYARWEEDQIVYSVRDNGVGFDMRFYDKLFGVFQRLHSENEFPGTGVGLAIAKRVIVRHGGKVWAQSDPGHETIFNFSLPREIHA